jgi:hypothetical protein
MIQMDVQDQQCMNFPREQITLHLVGPLDSMQIVMFQPAFNTVLVMIVVYLAAKQKAAHLFRSSSSMVAIHGLTMITHHQK